LIGDDELQNNATNTNLSRSHGCACDVYWSLRWSPPATKELQQSVPVCISHITRPALRSRPSTLPVLN